MKKANTYLVGLILLFFLCSVKYTTAQDYSQLDVWANEYCMTAKGFVNDFIATNKLEQRYDLSYAFVQHYKRTAESADNAIKKLSRIQLPKQKEGLQGWLRSKMPSWANYYSEVDNARNLNQVTISSLENIKFAASQAIADVNNASNSSLFFIATNKYNEKAKAEIQNLETANKKLSDRYQKQLQECSLNLIPSQ